MIMNLTANPQDIAITFNNIMKEVEYTIGDPIVRIDFKGFNQGIDCKLQTKYKFTQKSGDPLPSFIKAGLNKFTEGGYIEIYTNTRRDAS